jgi:hypothetical protein
MIWDFHGLCISSSVKKELKILTTFLGEEVPIIRLKNMGQNLFIWASTLNVG